MSLARARESLGQRIWGHLGQFLQTMAISGLGFATGSESETRRCEPLRCMPIRPPAAGFLAAVAVENDALAVLIRTVTLDSAHLLAELSPKDVQQLAAPFGPRAATAVAVAVTQARDRHGGSTSPMRFCPHLGHQGALPFSSWVASAIPKNWSPIEAFSAGLCSPGLLILSLSYIFEESAQLAKSNRFHHQYFSFEERCI